MYCVEMRVYLCHPETCGHEEHFTWWVIDKDKFEYLEGFEFEVFEKDFERSRLIKKLAEVC